MMTKLQRIKVAEDHVDATYEAWKWIMKHKGDVEAEAAAYDEMSRALALLMQVLKS